MNEPAPDPMLAAQMAIMDQWPKRWRELAHEHGYERVSKLKDGGETFDNAEMICLSVDYKRNRAKTHPGQ